MARLRKGSEILRHWRGDPSQNKPQSKTRSKTGLGHVQGLGNNTGAKTMHKLSVMGLLALLLPGHSLGLEELVVSRGSSETTKATALPSTMGQDGLIVDSHCVNVHGARELS